MIVLLLQTAALGFASGVMPGPLLAFLFLETLRRGGRKAVWLVAAPLVSDGPIAAVTLGLLGQADERFLRIVEGAGGVLLAALAARVLLDLRRDTPGGQGKSGGPPPDSLAAALRRGVAINFLGPGPWVFWGAVFGPLVVEEWRSSPAAGALLVICFYASFLSTMAAAVLLFAQARRLAGRGRRIARLAGAIVLLLFALRLWWRALG